MKSFDLHWLIESIPNDFLSLFHIPDGFWRVPLQRNTFNNVFLYQPRCCSFYTVTPLWSSGKTLAANAGGCGFESHRGHKHLFFTFYSIRVKCEKLFCKTNIKQLKSIVPFTFQYINYQMRPIQYFISKIFWIIKF